MLKDEAMQAPHIWHSDMQFSEISMNFMTDLPSSTLNDHVYDAVLMIVDWYTKIVKYLSIIKSVDVCSLVDFMYCHIFLMFDWLEGIVLD